MSSLPFFFFSCFFPFSRFFFSSTIYSFSCRPKKIKKEKVPKLVPIETQKKLESQIEKQHSFSDTLTETKSEKAQGKKID